MALSGVPMISLKTRAVSFNRVAALSAPNNIPADNTPVEARRTNEGAHGNQILLCLSAGVLSAGMLFGADSAATRLKETALVLREIMGTPDKAIPKELLKSARCIVIVPGMKKGAFVVGATYGRGFMSCRMPSGSGWSAPAGVKVEGGSFGFQIGGSETDAIMLVMNEGGAAKLMSSKFTLGADAAVAAGPVGRRSSADTISRCMPRS